MTNVGKSYRTGIEISGGLKPFQLLEWRFNLTLSRNKLIDFVEYYTDYNTTDWSSEYKSKNLGTVDIAYSPSITGSSEIAFNPGAGLRVHFISKYVGRQYFDNTMSRDRMLSPYLINNLRIDFEPGIKAVRNTVVQLLVNNIFNSEYESNAYGGNWYEDGVEKTWAYYFPQAGINYMVRLNIKF
jgi:iron complex outermembrane receptor protein